MKLRRGIVLAAVLAGLGGVAVVGVLIGDSEQTASTSPSGSSPGSSLGSSDADGSLSALRDPVNESFPEPLITVADLVEGGPPPDGIPPIDEPRFEPVEEVSWLGDDDPVLSLTVGGETRAYPIAIMTWHEIVNDEVGGTPVTYCPLCNSGVAFLREVDGQVLDFGTSGKLYADNLVMYDRQTESLWPQLTGLASVGVMTGTQLEAIPMGAVGWAQFRAAHPEALVLSRETGHARDYGRNPYVGYDDPDGRLLAPIPGGTDARLPVKERVIGFGEGAAAVALPRDLVADLGALETELMGDAVTVWHLPGQRSALDTAQIEEGRDIGSVAVFSTRVRGRELTWRRDGDGFVDDQTGSRWDLTGRAVSGPLEGAALDPVRHLDTFWFAWVAFQPDTLLLDEEAVR